VFFSAPLNKSDVDAANNAAKRSQRPMVVVRTAEQQGRSGVETIETLLQTVWKYTEIALLTNSSRKLAGR
jgi:hypothetical protein